MTTTLAAAYSAALLLFSLQFLLGYFALAWLPGLAATGMLLVLALTGTGTGRLVLRAFGTRDLSESEKTLIGCTLGLGVLSQGLFLLGVLGLLRLWAVAALLSGLWVIGFTEMKDVLFSFGANRNLLRERPLWIAAIGFFCGLVLWTAWMPPHQYDSLVYHLPLAASYVRTGKIAPIDHLLYSYFPQNGEMFFALALLLRSDILAHLFTWLAMLLSVWWIFEMGKREMPLSACLLACLLLCSHTAIMLLSSIAYVEAFAMLWITAAVLSFCRWHDISSGGVPKTASGQLSSSGVFEGGDHRGWLALSAVFAGLGVGTKYYAGLCPAVLSILLVVRSWKRKDASDLFLFSGIAALSGAPWLVRNAVTLGNPVFPFLYQYLPHRGVDWAPASARQYFNVLTEYGHPAGSFWKDLLGFPVAAAEGSARFGGGMDVLGVLGWGGIVAGLPVALWVASKNRALNRVLAYCGLHAAAWFCTGVVLRFLTVIVPLLCLVIAAGLYQLWGWLGRRGRTALVAGLVVFAATNLGLFLYVHSAVSTWNVLLGLETREQYLSRRLDYYPCAAHARDNLTGNDRILIVGEQRSYYVEQSPVATTVMAPNRFVEWANGSKNAEELVGLIRKEGGFTHLLLLPREFERLEPYGTLAFTPQGAKNWAELGKKRLKQIFTGGACALMEIE